VRNCVLHRQPATEVIDLHNPPQLVVIIGQKWPDSALDPGVPFPPDDKTRDKASAIACVKHVADGGVATNEVRAWLAMLAESLLVA
jgi:hypothetical protein